jgi:hypothetical protein
MPLRNVRLAVAGAGGQIEECREGLREVATRLAARYVKVDRTADDPVVDAVFDVPEERLDVLLQELAVAAKEALPPDPHEHLEVAEHPSRPHELAAQLLIDRGRGTPALPGALQAREDLEAWEWFLGEARPRGALELGTASGTFARWLNKRVSWLRTIDVARPDRRTPGFLRLDVWSRPEKVHDLIAKAPRPFVLYCDDGNKQLEVETFGPSLRTGDYLAVHDVGTEFFPEQMPAGYEELVVHGLTGFYRKMPC